VQNEQQLLEDKRIEQKTHGSHGNGQKPKVHLLNGQSVGRPFETVGYPE